MNKTHFNSQLHFWTHMLDEAFPEEAMLVEGKHWPEDYIKAATNMLKTTGKYAGGKTDADVQKIADRFRKDLHGNSPLGYFNTVVRWYAGDPDGFVKPLLDNGQAPDDKLKVVLQRLLSFLNNQALVDKYGQQVKSGMPLSDFSAMMKKVSDEDKARADSAEFEVKDNGYKIIPIMSYEELHTRFGGDDKTGYPTKRGSGWCHTNGKSTYDSWTDNYTKFFFVIAEDGWEGIKPKENPKEDDNAYDEYGLSLMAILVSDKGRLLNCTLRWNHVVEPKYTKAGRAVDKAFISYAELSQVTGIDVRAEVKKELVKILEYVKKIPRGKKIYEGPEGICFASNHLHWYDRDLNPIDPPDEINGDLIIGDLDDLVSLEGTPKVVNGRFNCSFTHITSLEFGPQIVNGDFDCSHTWITSLEGAPTEVGKSFICSFTNISSLEGCPKKIGGTLFCAYSDITSLEGAPDETNTIVCSNCANLLFLKGSPKIVNGNFNCSFSSIVSLEGAPREVSGNFNCSNTKIFSLEGAPKEIGGDLNITYTSVSSLKGAPAKIGGAIYLQIYKNITTQHVNDYKMWLKTKPTENYPG